MSDNPSAAFARELVAALAQAGVRDYVLCPGSRSGPLAHALAEAASDSRPVGAPEVDLHVRIDERSAAFLALGLARGRAVIGSPSPVAVVTTSGTAVGNLMPAVMEAHHSGVPLLLLTADRPSELHGVGANQTTDQSTVFGPFARWEVTSPAPLPHEKPGRAARLALQAVRAAMGENDRDAVMDVAGPVHLNLEFRAPLAADGGPWPAVTLNEPDKQGKRLRAIVSAVRNRDTPLPVRERGVVIAGDGAGDVARWVAETHGWPLLAEATSGARTGPNAVPAYVQLLRSERGAALVKNVTTVAVVGRPTLTREVLALMETAPALHVAAHGARWREAPARADKVHATVPKAWLMREPDAPVVNAEWLEYWTTAGARLADQTPDAWDADAVACVFVSSLGDDGLGVLGSSGPVRAVDRVAPVWEPGASPVLIANRGLSGIDGTVSTASGIALAAGPTAALVGDVTFLHEVGGLLVGPLERRPDLRIVVVNDGGGTIFASLEHGGGNADAVRRVFTTPHGADIAALCAGYGVNHVRVTSVPELTSALEAPISGVDVVEAVL